MTAALPPALRNYPPLPTSNAKKKGININIIKKSISKKYLQGFLGFFFVTFVYVLDVLFLGIKGVLSHRPVMMDVLDGRVFSSSIWCFDERGGNYDKQQKMPCDNTLTARRGRQQLQNCLKLNSQQSNF